MTYDTSNHIDLTDLASFKAWTKQNPDARKLLGTIVFRWRGSFARLPGDPVAWAAYPLATWRGWTNLKRSTLDRRLADLLDAGLIEKERHRFAGTIICPWIRPTELALTHAGTPADLARLKAKKSTPKPPASEATIEATPEATVEATVEATDHTSIPFSASSAIEPKTSPNKFGEGKGKARQEDEVSVKGMVEAAFVKQYGSNAYDPNDPEWQMLAQSAAKKLAKLLEKYPRLTGKHEPHVKHPYDLNPKWAGFSPELRASRYAKYVEYVNNWYTGNGGKPGKAMDYDPEIDAYYAKLADDPAHKAKWNAEQKSKTTH